MWLSLCLYIIISITIIIIGHYLLHYLKDTFTVSKHRNIYHSQIEKYKNIIEEIENPQIKSETSNDEFTEEQNDLMNFANECLQ